MIHSSNKVPGCLPFGARVLVVRNDGIGDFVHTLPLIASLKEQRPDIRICVLVQEALLPLIPWLPQIETALGDVGVLLKRHQSRFSAVERRARQHELLVRLREKNFAAALFPYVESASAALVHRAGVPLRVGPLRKVFFWRFNRFQYDSRRSSRRSSRRTEYALNLKLLRCLNLFPRYVPPRLEFPQPLPAQRSVVEDPRSREVLLHPLKKNCTALPWPLERFVQLAQRLRKRNVRVGVLGDAEEAPQLRAAFADLSGVRLWTDLDLHGLMTRIARAAALVGNSSGPLHLAALAGIPHVGLYAQNQLASRWYPLPWVNTQRTQNHPTPAHWLSPKFPKRCIYCTPRCVYYNCLARGIRVEDVETRLHALLSGAENLSGSPFAAS